jgi:hypothetical protein
MSPAGGGGRDRDTRGLRYRAWVSRLRTVRDLRAVVITLAVMALAIVVLLAAFGAFSEGPNAQHTHKALATTSPLLSISGGMPTPAPSPLAPAPPSEVQTALKSALVTFVPLTDAQLATVTVTRTEAEQVALADPGMGYGPNGSRVTWKKVGCVFLGYYTGMQEPSIGYVPPTYPAYLVQVLADPIPDFPMLNIGVVVVNATTGERGTTFGAGQPPYGVMGSTCGVGRPVSLSE